MEKSNGFSRVTKEYLCEYEEILGTMICKMTSAELGDSISERFINQMIPHHMAAIEMSRNILKYTTNLRLQSIADNIISEQTQSIADMTEIERCCSEVCNSKSELTSYQGRTDSILKAMFAGMKNARAVNCINCSFIREMIPHHMGAVRMSENALGYDVCRELKPILRSIIASQRRGIMQMRRLASEINCSLR